MPVRTITEFECGLASCAKRVQQDSLNLPSGWLTSGNECFCSSAHYDKWHKTELAYVAAHQDEIDRNTQAGPGIGYDDPATNPDGTAPLEVT